MRLFRNLRQNMLQEGRLRKYLFYALGEILLVMIGILLALQVDQCSRDSQNRKEELRYYANLKNELLQQRQNIEGQFNYNAFHLGQFAYLLEASISRDISKRDTLAHSVPYLFNYSDFDYNANIYETLVNSGDINLINNQGIIKDIRSIESRYQYINRMEDIHWEIILHHISNWIGSNFNFVELEKTPYEVLFSAEYQNSLLLLQRIMEEKETIYKNAIDEINSLIEQLDNELSQEN